MISIKHFREFLFSQFPQEKIFYDDFKPDLNFVEIDCFDKKSNSKLVLEISKESIKFSTISNEPSIDFSLYDFIKKSNNEAEEFIIQIKNLGWPKL